MKLDLAAAAAAISKATTGKLRAGAEWTGGKIEIDEAGFVGRLADGVAMMMGQNLYRGMRPDGGGPMPGRKEDGKPRGKGSSIARALNSIQQGSRLEWLIAAHREQPGHLARIMQEVPLRAPPLETLKKWINEAFKRSVKTGELGGALVRRAAQPFGRALRSGGEGLRPTKVGQTLGGTKASRAPASWGGLGKSLKMKKPRSVFASAVRFPKRPR